MNLPTEFLARARGAGEAGLSAQQIAFPGEFSVSAALIGVKRVDQITGAVLDVAEGKTCCLLAGFESSPEIGARRRKHIAVRRTCRYRLEIRSPS
jgi:hypothetical protein